ncbi:hypothetical protein BYT27DRAFT_7203802 [Phlegmacium glaucopus]|nr:hypothetical protein BYT27DRAFT_7203802 [Phlegmacium glaucopus]
MPSLPATSRLGSSRGGRPSHNFSHTKPLRRSKKGLGKSLKQRLIRRSTDSRAHLKHSSASNLRAPASNLAKPENSVLESLEIALDRKGAKNELPVVAEVTAIPNPTPGTATAPLPADAQGYGSPLLNPVAIPTSVSFLFSTRSRTARPLYTFSALPPLRSLVASPTAANISTQASETSSMPPVEMLPTQTMDAGAHRDSQPHQVSLAVIVLLAVGAGLLLLGACIIIKMCTRPTRQPRPTPSLPVLNDLDPDDQFYESKESPIFGGKERLSPLQGTHGPTWTWVQYPQPASKVSQSINKDINSSQETTTNDSDSCSSCQTQPTTQNPASQYSQDLTRQSFLQHHPPNILTNASNRLSVTSMSLYSPQANIGLAIGGARETGFTADGCDVLKRSKTLNKRKSQSGLEDRKCRDSTESSIHLAYDAEVLSPAPTEYIQVQETPIISTSERRARVKSSYFAAGTYPRVSTFPSGSYSIATATKVNVAHRNSFGIDKNPLQRSNSRRQRDAQALTHALGLTSPNSESPVPTLYPDDSMSVAENKRPRKRNPSDRKPVETIPLSAPLPDSGQLMKMEFGVSQMSLSGLALDGDESETGRMQAEEELGSRRNIPITLPLRTMDKPPRVPSPVPLPSLTQMGLAHNNPESYANYRSPTYSIYGFYENDRMSSFAR